MLTAYDAYNLANYPNYQNRVRYYMFKYSVANVLTEVASTPGHAARLTLATNILQGYSSRFEMGFFLGVLANGTIFSEAVAPGHGQDETSGIPDTDLEFAVYSIFNAVAGFDPN